MVHRLHLPAARREAPARLAARGRAERDGACPPAARRAGGAGLQRTLGASALVAIAIACARAPAEGQPAEAVSTAPIPEEARWLLHGTDDERLARVAAHLRGLDVAMIETGHRYAELHWAGRDRNWDYAAYQLGKIEVALARGIERRPRRASSARMLDGPVAGVRAAITSRDAAAFERAFGSLTDACNACHRAERVPYVRVAPPTVRATVVAPPGDAAP